MRLQSTELSRIVAAIRDGAGRDGECESKLNAVFNREEERVADASVLAEVLLPLLRESSAVMQAAQAYPANPPVSRARRAPRARSATAPGIADFIDEMIQLERPAPPAGAQ